MLFQSEYSYQACGREEGKGTKDMPAQPAHSLVVFPSVPSPLTPANMTGIQVWRQCPLASYFNIHLNSQALQAHLTFTTELPSINSHYAGTHTISLTHCFLSSFANYDHTDFTAQNFVF